MNKAIIAGLLAFMSGVSQAQQALPDIREGLWEIKSQASVSGLALAVPEQTMTQCLTKRTMNPQNLLQQSNCRLHHLTINANSAQWQMSCLQQGIKMEGEGQLRYQKNQFKGVFDLMMSGAPEGAMAMHTQISGHYIGNCR